jgi:hypothetical protein
VWLLINKTSETDYSAENKNKLHLVSGTDICVPVSMNALSWLCLLGVVTVIP